MIIPAIKQSFDAVREQLGYLPSSRALSAAIALVCDLEALVAPFVQEPAPEPVVEAAPEITPLPDWPEPLIATRIDGASV